MRAILLAFLAVTALSACVPTYPAGDPAGIYAPAVPTAAPAPLAPRQAASNFIRVVSRVEPMTEEICRARTRGVNCDFRIVIDDRAGQGPNAFQTLDETGRPILGFTLALIADARNEDEIAFVLGHEAAHHILGHIPQTQQTAMAGAVMAGILAQATGADPAAVDAAQRIGATVGARRYSRAFELEADALGAEIAFYAGYDPVLGAGFFDRLPDPGDQFLGSHPPNSERKAQVRAIVAQLQGF
ncbi:MAG: M48 family metallopeptidase [Rhodobacteraceae bacterium]|nr:M48 family metallopeptidase [Paracoccaceae bacterium]